ncbi:transposase [Bradyrhizobium sp. STM 3562]|uniref:transposase n=1 Tax=Bradyrhizobium sp. STM 3562 TaxID=578924 RepID=UPI00388EB9F2
MIEAVADRLEGAPRQLRRRWSDEFKAQVVTEALEPGASVSAIARRIGIHPSQLFTWRRDARAERHYRSRPFELRGRGGICGRRSDRDCHWRGRRACRR